MATATSITKESRTEIVSFIGKDSLLTSNPIAGRLQNLELNCRRSYNDILELTEVSLDVTLTDNHIRYKFAESPVLSVHITERGDFVVVLVTTVNSLHRLYFQHPEKLNRIDGNSIYRSRSIFKDATVQDAKDPASFFALGQHSASSEFN